MILRNTLFLARRSARRPLRALSNTPRPEDPANKPLGGVGPLDEHHHSEHNKFYDDLGAHFKNSMTHMPEVDSHQHRPWRAASALGNATLQYTQEINRYYELMENSLMKRINESNKRRFRIVFIATISFIVWVSLVYGEKIRMKITEKTAGIAKETLENESLKIQTQELAMAVVQTILNDESIAAHAAGFLRTASNSKETQQALVDLTLHVLSHPETQKEVMVLLKKLVAAAANDKEVLEQLTGLILSAIADERVMAAVSALFRKLCEDPDVLLAASVLTEKVFAKEPVVEAANRLLADSSQKVLQDAEVISKSREFVADVMGDDAIQREGGDALWNSVTHALTPGIRRIGGIGLLAVSIGLVKLFLSPY